MYLKRCFEIRDNRAIDPNQFNKKHMVKPILCSKKGEELRKPKAFLRKKSAAYPYLEY